MSLVKRVDRSFHEHRDFIAVQFSSRALQHGANFGGACSSSFRPSPQHTFRCSIGQASSTNLSADGAVHMPWPPQSWEIDIVVVQPILGLLETFLQRRPAADHRKVRRLICRDIVVCSHTHRDRMTPPRRRATVRLHRHCNRAYKPTACTPPCRYLEGRMLST